MNKALLFITFSLTFALVTAQDFAPLGATWHYTHRYMGPETDINTLTVIDANFYINGQFCSKISKTHASCSPEFEYVYEQNNVVFLLNQNSNQFDTLYNFNLSTGEGWGNNIIDSVVYQNVNGVSLKGLYVNGSTYGGPILEKIGGSYSFISDNPICDPADGGWIKCYTDDVIGLYEVTTGECDAITDIEEITITDISISPNPANNFISISGLEAMTVKNILIYDYLGVKWIEKELKSNTLNIENLPRGMYFIQIEHNNIVLINKKIIIE